MDCTILTYINWKKSIRYWIDPVLDTRDIETYLYKSIPDNTVEEIKKVSYDKLQDILKSL